ncbi:unnamed protein product, partial [Callosobruchus maculatus]
ERTINADSQATKVSVFLFYGLICVSACFILFLIKERACNSRHLQYVAGVKVPVFWLVHLFFDFLLYVFVCLLATIVVVCLQVDGYKTAEDLGRMWIVLTYFGCSSLPLIYLCVYKFEVPATGYMFISFCYIGVVVLKAVLTLIPWKKRYSRIMEKALLCFPSYSLLSGLEKSHAFSEYKKRCEESLDLYKKLGITEENCWDAMFMMNDCVDYSDSYYKYGGQGVGENIVYSMVTGMVFFALVLLIDYDFLNPVFGLLSTLMPCRRPKVPKDEDSDVAEERKRISSMSTKDVKTSHELAIKDLTKYYWGIRAVNGLSLGVKKNECFGLLGVNGAGKTTTFKMMTGDVMMTYGKGWVRGYSLWYQMRKVHECIGYCPQFDALIDDMTAKETLIMFAMIKGHGYSDAKTLAITFSENLDFKEHVNKQVRKLSGGNKRKLSAAVAMIGDPPVLYFDEPTSGMDPATKYYFREVVRKIRDSGKCIILTSHSLDECESVCTRLAIMASGRFMCLGSVQHLKSKFAKGCTFTIKIKRDANESSVNNVEKYVSDNLPSAKLSEKHQEMLTYKITGVEIPWSKIFSILEGAKRNIKDVEDYSLQQSSLEQVFLSFTKQAKEAK